MFFSQYRDHESRKIVDVIETKVELLILEFFCAAVTDGGALDNLESSFLLTQHVRSLFISGTIIR